MLVVASSEEGRSNSVAGGLAAKKLRAERMSPVVMVVVRSGKVESCCSLLVLGEAETRLAQEACLWAAAAKGARGGMPAEARSMVVSRYSAAAALLAVVMPVKWHLREHQVTPAIALRSSS